MTEQRSVFVKKEKERKKDKVTKHQQVYVNMITCSYV
jgi:hypothetical protein